jgi:hypothetical protein
MDRCSDWRVAASLGRGMLDSGMVDVNVLSLQAVGMRSCCQSSVTMTESQENLDIRKKFDRTDQ